MEHEAREAASRRLVVRCAGAVYEGTVISTRSEWASEGGVLVSILLKTKLCGLQSATISFADGTRQEFGEGALYAPIRFYFNASDADAWAMMLDRPMPYIEAVAMKREAA